MKNKLVVGLEDNSELREYLAQVSPGDTVEFEVTATLDEQTTSSATFSVTEATAISEAEPAPSDSEMMGEDVAAPTAVVFGDGGAGY